MTSRREATPVRALGVEHDDGYLVISSVPSTYRDGAESELAQIMRSTTNLSSTSDELGAIPETWAIRYHLDNRRGNVLRALDLRADAKVLEIGAGCGAISRYLGEQCGLVDSVEPVESRALVAALRTRDLDSVQVIVGELADVPPEPVYDVAVVVGVLEYVGNGSSEDAPYREFLEGLRARLAPGGTLVLAIENPLGAKYLAGSPEDHTGRYFDSVEGYVSPGPARTFSRRKLNSLIEGAGFDAIRTLAAFPDYKMLDTVLDMAILDGRPLARTLPGFPSPDWTLPRPRIADESRIWSTLVDAGLGMEFSNSFLVVASVGAPSVVWPQNRAAVRFTPRRNENSIERIVATDHLGELRYGTQSLSQFASREPLHAGTRVAEGPTLVEVAASESADMAGLIAGWVSVLDMHIDSESGKVPFDLTPRNVCIEADVYRPGLVGKRMVTLTRDQAIDRGILLLAIDVAKVTPPIRWPGFTSVRQIAMALKATVTLEHASDSAWLDRTIDREARIETEARICPLRFVDVAGWYESIREEIAGQVDALLVDLPLGDRVPDIDLTLTEAFDLQAVTRSEIARASAEVQLLREKSIEAEALLGTRTMRLRSRVIRLLGR